MKDSNLSIYSTIKSHVTRFMNPKSFLADLLIKVAIAVLFAVIYRQLFHLKMSASLVYACAPIGILGNQRRWSVLYTISLNLITLSCVYFFQSYVESFGFIPTYLEGILIIGFIRVALAIQRIIMKSL